MSFSENLQLLMKKNNLKNIDLAKALEIDKSNITYYLKGKKFPTYENLQKLIKILNCDYNDLLK